MIIWFICYTFDYIIKIVALNTYIMRIKYNRTSTLQQEGNRFIEDDKSGEYNAVLFDKGVSGSVNFKDRAQGSKLLQMVDTGQVKEVVFEEFSRIGRNSMDTLNTINYLKDAGVRICIKNYSLCSTNDNGKVNPLFGMMTKILSEISEQEKHNIIERTAQGRAVYLANGGKLGREKGDTESTAKFLSKDKNRTIVRLLNQNKSYRDICGRVGCSPSTIRKVKKALTMS